VPADWQPSEEVPEPFNLFYAKADGNFLDVDLMVAEAAATGVNLSEAPSAPPIDALPAGPAWIPGTEDDLVTERMREQYLALRKGEHHLGLFTFMCQVASRAAYVGRPLSAGDLVESARRIDSQSVISTNPARCLRIESEAKRALAFAAQNVQHPLDAQHQKEAVLRERYKAKIAQRAGS